MKLFKSETERQKERERKIRQSLAYNQLTDPLRNHLLLLFHIYKTTLPRPPSRKSLLVSELFNDRYFSELKYFNILMTVPPLKAHAPKNELNWVHYLAQEFKTFRDSLEQVVDLHLSQMELKTITLIDEILNCHFLSVMVNFPTIQRIQKGRFEELTERVRKESGDSSGHTPLELHYLTTLEYLTYPYFRYYTRLLIQLVELHNLNVLETKQIIVREDWWSKEFPAPGICRLEEPTPL